MLLCRASCRITFLWIPSHRGIPGYEDADNAAKEASTLYPIPNEKITRTDANKSVSKLFQQKWERTWNHLPATNKLRSIRSNTSRWQTFFRKNRGEETLLCRLRIGHASITHFYLLNETPRPICIPCSVPIIIQHILTECHEFNQYRSQISLSISLSDLLDSNENTIKKLFLFLRLSNLLPKLQSPSNHPCLWPLSQYMAR